MLFLLQSCIKNGRGFQLSPCCSCRGNQQHFYLVPTYLPTYLPTKFCRPAHLPQLSVLSSFVISINNSKQPSCACLSGTACRWPYTHIYWCQATWRLPEATDGMGCHRVLGRAVRWTTEADSALCVVCTQAMEARCMSNLPVWKWPTAPLTAQAAGPPAAEARCTYMILMK
jgi:hypothetical protein